MRAEDRQTILDMIQKMKEAAADPALRAMSDDLATIVMMAADPELDMAEHPPVILNQGGRVYRAYPIV